MATLCRALGVAPATQAEAMSAPPDPLPASIATSVASAPEHPAHPHLPICTPEARDQCWGLNFCTYGRCDPSEITCTAEVATLSTIADVPMDQLSVPIVDLATGGQTSTISRKVRQQPPLSHIRTNVRCLQSSLSHGVAPLQETLNSGTMGKMPNFRDTCQPQKGSI